MQLVRGVRDLLTNVPDVAAIMRLEPFETFPELLGALFGSLCNNPSIGLIIAETYAANTQLVDLSIHDIAETARRNFEPGGEATTLLFSRGIQAIVAHRVAHKLWADGNTNLALAVKSTCGRVFDTDIHPAAEIGAGLWLDHGLGFVVGETCVIEEDVSIWHNVTLGSTLADSGPQRHPYIKSGVVVGAGAILLGGITVGANANIGAGAIVVQDVAEATLVTGQRAEARGAARISFTQSEALQ
jgi:serine O-acetyltransferase